MSELSAAYTAGMATRRRVLGDAHVDHTSAAASDFNAGFQAFITEGAWGTIWSGPELSPRERSLALLAALGHEEELALHLRATRNTGATPDDIRAAFMHVAVYAGAPAANTAFGVARRVLAEEA